MSGIARIAKTYGSIIIQGKRYVWDYVADEAVPENEMPAGSKRWKDSERRRIELLKQSSQPGAGHVP